MVQNQKLGVTGLTLHNDKLWGFYRATVKSVTDPKQQGRIKAEVIPYFVDIETTLLPWAVPASPLKSGSGVGTGSFDVPDVNSMVWVFFEMGDIYQPVYIANASDGVHGLPTFRTTNYPNRRGWKTSSGIEFYTDDTDESVTLIHPSGTTVVIDVDGNVTLTSTGVVTITGDQIQLNPV
jgi:hypothetical protein